jgi:hypothetical protein
VYSGPTSEVLPHFASQGYVCPEHFNPAGVCASSSKGSSLAQRETMLHNHTLLCCSYCHSQLMAPARPPWTGSYLHM